MRGTRPDGPHRVSYGHRIEYALDLAGRRFPRLSFEIARAEDPGTTIDVEAHLDSGAERTLFSGLIGVALGIDLLSGPELVCRTATGSQLVAALHPVRLRAANLGVFDLEVGFSTTDMQRNLLGRDFFNLTQIGFREHHLEFYITPSP